MSSTLKHIKLSSIRENPIALRSVDRDNPEYIQLAASIKARGVLESILVRELKDPETGQTFYGLVNGLQRFTASQDAGFDTIPAQIMHLSDMEVLDAQIITNAQRVETKPVEYSKQLIHILASNPLLTMGELAGRLHKSVAWLNERLRLVKLDNAIAPLANEGQIVLANACALANLPPDEQSRFVDRAMTLPPSEFVPTVNARAKEIRDAKRQGRDPNKSNDFIPVPHIQKLSVLKSELENPTVSRLLIAKADARTPADGFALALQWALHLDPISIEQGKADHAARLAKEAASKELRKKAAAEKRAEAAASAQAAVSMSIEDAV